MDNSYIPDDLQGYESDNINTDMEDKLACIVMERFRRAVLFRNTYTQYQNRSVREMMWQIHRQMHSKFDASTSRQIQEAMNMTNKPDRYYNLSWQKSTAAIAWFNDLIVNNLDSLFTVSPTADPTIDRSTTSDIEREVRNRLFAKMQAANLSDPNILMNAKNTGFNKEVEQFLREKAVEVTRAKRDIIVGRAQEAADNIKTKMVDILQEGGFRQEYQHFNYDRFTYGMGIMRFPVIKSVAALSYEKDNIVTKWVKKPTFYHVAYHNFYPICDSDNVSTNTANIEYRHITKMELSRLRALPNYNKEAIEYILRNYEYAGRDWICLEQDNLDQENITGWLSSDTIPLLIHEGFFTGRDLYNNGIMGYDDTEIVNVKVEVCGRRVIRYDILKMPGGMERTYYAAPMLKSGKNIYDNLSFPMVLYDIEQRINITYYLWEYNLNEVSRPAKLVNESAFSDPADADDIRPGQSYKVEDQYLGSATMPEPVRLIATGSAQYHIIQSQLPMLLKAADEISLFPAFTYSAANMGQASLGEFAQRFSSVGKLIKLIALNEDTYFIKQGFTNLYNHVILNNPELRKGADIYPNVQGLTGLFKEDVNNQRMQSFAQLALQNPQPNPNGIYPMEVVNYIARELAKSNGVPVDSLGMDNSVLDFISNRAAQQTPKGVIPGTPQAPSVDGRSAPAIPNVAQPNGMSNSSFSVPIPNGGAS